MCRKLNKSGGELPETIFNPLALLSVMARCLKYTLEGTHVYIAEVFVWLTVEMSSALLCKY